MIDLLTQAPASGALHQAMHDILLAVSKHVRQTVNETMLQAYWHVGRLNVEDEHGDERRAEYGKYRSTLPRPCREQ